MLCEGLQDWVFVRRMLITLGYESHRIRVIPYPAGRGSGEQHVRERYADELGRHRSRAARTRAVLVVQVDADRSTVEARHAALELTLQEKGVAPRSPQDTVAILVPKRAIETWIHFFLDGPPVDEDTRYEKYAYPPDAWPAADAFAKHVRARTEPAGAPPSLPPGLREARRVL